MTNKLRHKCLSATLIMAIIFIAAGSLKPILAQSTQPAPSHTPADEAVKIEFNRRVPMRDRVELSADVYRPEASGRYPVILSRTPYTKTSASTFKIAKY